MDNQANSHVKSNVKGARIFTKNSKNVVETVETFLDEGSKGLTSDILVWIKQQFEANIHYWIGEKLGKINVSLVVDSNVIIQTIKYYAKGKMSILFKLAENPIFPIYAPKEIEKEILDFIEKKNKKKSDKLKLHEGWQKLKQILKIRKIHDFEAKEEAMKIIGHRDLSDVPFVSLYIETGAAAILTNDEHYNIPEVKRFNIGELNDVVGVFHRGFFSFFIMNDVIPLVLQGLSKIVVAVAKVFYEFLKLIFDICMSVVSGTFDKITELIYRIPEKAQNWVIGGFIITAFAFSLLMIFHKGAREKILGMAKSVWNSIKSNIEKLVEWLVESLQSLFNFIKLFGPYIGISIEIISVIQKHIETLSDEIKNFRIENAVNYS